MIFQPGATLGPYEVVGPLGHGGMGEVYRARDTRLDRTVAIKVVTGATSSFESVSTLEREARAVAALNHPHICALHDVSRDGDVPFLVMEYVEGETLAARLARGKLPVQEAVRYGIQIAEALDHAHRHGVVHRNLKPANIMLTKSGVKVLDFGVARLRAAARLEMPLDRTPAAQPHLAAERTLVGSVQYLAPERLEGRDADAASDIFAFGALMFEMATGRRAFDSNSPAGVIAAILQTEPPIASTLQPAIPPALDGVIQKSLARSPEARWQAAGDIVEVLRWIARGHAEARVQSAPRRGVLWLALAVSLAAAAWFAYQQLSRPKDSTAALTFSIFPPTGGGFTPTPSSVPSPQFAVSPNGRQLAFVASVAPAAPQLWIRPLDSLSAQPLPGTDNAEYPFWSPDSESVGFFANGSLKRVDLAGGPARVLAAASHGRGGAWNRNGFIAFAPNTQSGLLRVSATGGDTSPLTTVDTASREASHRWPQFLPDDQHFIYFVQGTSSEGHGIYVGDIHGSRPTRLRGSPLSAAFVAPDHLLFVVDEALMAVGFDWKGQRLVGEPLQIVAPVAGSSNFYAAFSASDTGLLVYASSAASSELVWMDRSGQRVGSIGPAAQYVDFRLSPHDRQLAIGEVDPQTHRPDIRVLDLTRGSKLRITFDAATDASPIWSPDGTQIVFRSNRGGLHDLYQRSASGAGQNSLIYQSGTAKYPTDWTADGRIIYHAYEGDSGANIWMMKPDGSSSSPLVMTQFDEIQGQVSADGRWLAYTSFETGRAEVYLRSISDGSQRWQVSAGGGSDPRWRSDARELFYLSADSKVTSVPFTGAAPDAPRALFKVHVLPPGTPFLSNYNVSRDGQRFLLKQPVHDVTSAPIHVLANWASRR